LKDAYNLALQDVNERKVEGRFIPVYVDTQGNPDKAIELAKSTLIPAGVLAVVNGAVNRVAIPLSKSFDQLNIPYIVGGATADTLTRPGSPWVFRVGPAESFFWRPLLPLLSEARKNVQTVEFLVPKASYPMFVPFETELRERNISVKTFSFEVASPKLAFAFPKSRPDGIIFGAPTTDVITIMKGMQQIRYTPKLLAFIGPFNVERLMNEVEPDVWDSAFVSGIQRGVPATPEFQSFEKRFRSQFKRDPTIRETIAYSSFMATAEAIQRAVDATARIRKPLTHQDVREALSKTKITAAFGRVTFVRFEGFQNQNPSIENGQVVVRQWQDRKLYIVWPEKLREKPPVYR
jgi:branched-chain amino acid transport system substrate-binding protein